MESRNDWTIPPPCALLLYSKCAESPSKPPLLSPRWVQPFLCCLVVTDQAWLKLSPCTVPPVFPGGWTGWWMEESRPWEPPPHPLLLSLLQKSNSPRGGDLFVCHTEFLLLHLGILFISEKTFIFNHVELFLILTMLFFASRCFDEMSVCILIQTGLSHCSCNRTVVAYAAQLWRSVVAGLAQTHFLVWESWKVELWDIKDF